MDLVKERPGFDRKMTREEINRFPVKAYEGPAQLIRSTREVPSAVRELKNETVLGFDTETRPAFKKGISYPPALLQLAGSSGVYLFQLSSVRLPSGLKRLLADPNIIKAGVAPNQDLRELRELGDFKPAGFVDLGEMARRAGIQNHGLRGLASVLLGFRISKRAQTSNWARKELSPEQVAYAATDAWVSRELYLHLEKNYLG